MIRSITSKCHLVHRGRLLHIPYGVTLSNDLSDTFTIVHAKGAQGAVINNASGSRLDFGVMVLSLMSHPMKKIKSA